MAKAPGDPRTNAIDDIPFDPNEYPNVHHVPSELPPAPPNAKGYIPYRGQEQHGVRFNSVAAEYGTLADEQRAMNEYNSDVTPRDLENVKPVKVAIVNEPDLIHELRSRQTSYTLNPGGVIQVAQYQQLRTRLMVMISGIGDTVWPTVLISSDSQPSSLNSVRLYFNTMDTPQQIIETESHDPFYVKLTEESEQPISVSVWTEYWHYDGEQLI